MREHQITHIRRTTEKALRRARIVAKATAHRTLLRTHGAKSVVFIVGCQRSGTTLLSRIFDRDRRASVYPEQSKLSSRDPKRLRLDPISEVAERIGSNPAPIIVLKPLVESQNIIQLLDHFQDSRAVWLYRHYADVAASYVHRWHDVSVRDLASIVGNENDWRNDQVPEYVRDVVTQHYDPAMRLHDASALYWFARNSLIIEPRRARDDRIIMCRYEDLVGRPQHEVARLYEFIGVPLPSSDVTCDVHGQSVNKGAHVTLSQPIEALCQETLSALDRLRY